MQTWGLGIGVRTGVVGALSITTKRNLKLFSQKAFLYNLMDLNWGCITLLNDVALA